MRSLVTLATLVVCMQTPAEDGAVIGYADRIIPDSNGKFFVLLERTGGTFFRVARGPVSLIFATRGQKLGPARQIIAGMEMDVDDEGWYYRKVNSPDVGLDKGDRAIHKTTLEQPPGAVLVSKDGWGYALLDRYGANILHNRPLNAVGVSTMCLVNGRPHSHSYSLKELFRACLKSELSSTN